MTLTTYYEGKQIYINHNFIVSIFEANDGRVIIDTVNGTHTVKESMKDILDRMNLIELQGYVRGAFINSGR